MNKLYLIIPLFLLLPIFIPDKAFNEEHVTNIPLKDIVYVDLETQKIVETIKEKESRGNCNAKGASGEIGCFQIMPNTYRALTKKHLGEVKGYSTSTAEFVVYKEIYELKSKNITPKQIFQIWNQGTYTKPCIKGVNKFGVKYDSCQYVKDAMKIYAGMQYNNWYNI